MNRITIAKFLLLFCGVSFSHAGQIVPETTAPNGQVAIERRQDSNRVDFLFFDTGSRQGLGSVLPARLVGLQEVQIETRWLPDASKVAVLLSYGTKLNTVMFYARQRSGSFRTLETPDIDPIAFYELKQKRRFPRDEPGYDENALGRWINNDKFLFVRGTAKEYEVGTRHFLLLIEVQVTSRAATITNRTPLGVLSDNAAQSALAKYSAVAH